MKRKYKPYNLDMKYEYKTYKHVGVDYGNDKTANLGICGNISRFIRKIVNQEEKQYAFCDTYSEWKEHLKKILPNKNYCNYTDLLHWLYEKRNSESSYLEAIKCILIPIYLALFSMYQIFLGEYEVDKGVVLIILVIIVSLSTVVLYSATRKLQFYEDFIEVVGEIDDK